MSRRTLPWVVIAAVAAVMIGGCKRRTLDTRKRTTTSSAKKAAAPARASVPARSGKPVEPRAATGPFSATCGNGKCDVSTGEDCIVCTKDCGKCDGCSPKKAPHCNNCKCEKCVCKLRHKCCAHNGIWDTECVKLCKDRCGGCGLR